MNKKLLVLFCAFALMNSCGYAQEKVPVEMSLEMAGAEAAGFRGSNPNSSNKQYLEDCDYKTDENSLIYKNAGEAVGDSGAVAVGKPNINWTITKQGENGDDDEVVSNTNNNSQSCNSNFTNPGTYHVTNCGSRQLSDAAGAGDGGVMTAGQTIGVVVNDVTPPDVCIAFQEGAGNSCNCKCEEDLEKQIVEKMVARAGQPFVTSAEEVANEPTSYLFVDEGATRNVSPNSKTVRVTLAGTMFNEGGSATYNNAVVPTSILNGGDKTRQANVASSKSDGVFSGIYVRRNVPFFVLVRSIDNGDKRKSIGSSASDGISYTIKDSNGKEVAKEEDGSYLFRVQNFPREQYNDQPEYFFEAKVFDGSGNLTTVKSDVYVVNNSASFEN